MYIFRYIQVFFVLCLSSHDTIIGLSCFGPDQTWLLVSRHDTVQPEIISCRPKKVSPKHDGSRPCRYDTTQLSDLAKGKRLCEERAGTNMWSYVHNLQVTCRIEKLFHKDSLAYSGNQITYICFFLKKVQIHSRTINKYNHCRDKTLYKHSIKPKRTGVYSRDYGDHWTTSTTPSLTERNNGDHVFYVRQHSKESIYI